MCDYCKEIKDYGEVDNPEYVYDEIIGIAKSKDKYNLYLESFDGRNVSVVEDIKYCPYCGRKLE